MEEWVKTIAVQGPLVGVMAIAIVTLWRRYERVQAEKDTMRDKHQEHLDILAERQRITTEKYAEKTIENQTKLHAILESMVARKLR